MQALALTCFVLLQLASSSSGFKKCSDLNIHFFVDSSSMSAGQFGTAKQVLKDTIDSLARFQALEPLVEINVSISSMSTTLSYDHKPVGLAHNVDYLKHVIADALPKLNGKCLFKPALDSFIRLYLDEEDAAESTRRPRQNVLAVVTNSYLGIFENQSIVYQTEIRSLVFDLFSHSDAFLKLFKLDPKMAMPEYMVSEPACAHMIDVSDYKNTVNGIRHITEGLYEDSPIAYNCVGEHALKSLPCVANMYGEHTLLCDGSLLSLVQPPIGDKSFPYEVLFKPENAHLLVNLTIMQIAAFNVSYFPASEFASSAHSLFYLVLRYNRMTKLDNRTLKGFVNLISVHFDGNLIEAIDDYSFFGLERLENLTFTHNSLRSIGRLDLAGLVALSFADFTDNALVEIEPGAFETCAQLKLLFLTSNMFKQFRGHEFAGLDKLIYLDLSLNEIEAVPAALFRPLTSLKGVSLQHNEIRAISSNMFSPGSLVASVVASHNRIARVDPLAFSNLNQVQYIDLAFNELSADSLPLVNSSLFFLYDISNQQGHMDGVALDASFFDKLARVNESLELVMSRNEIGSIRPDAFAAVARLTGQLRSFKLHISLSSFAALVRPDICNLRHLRVKNSVTALVIPDLAERPDDPSANADRRLLRENCQLRMLMARLNVVILRMVYPAFGAACQNAKFTDCSHLI